MKYVALVLGLVLLALGIADFVPNLNSNGLLFGVLPVPHAVAVGLMMVGAFAMMGPFADPVEKTEAPRITGHDMREWMAHS